jgi:predicted nuclease with TOPRIM domain
MGKREPKFGEEVVVHGSVVRVVGIAIFTFVLGVLSYWWFLQVVERDPQNLQAKIERLESDVRDKESTNDQLRLENQRLRRENTALQDDVISLKERISALESTKVILESDVRDRESTNDQLRLENQRLRRENTALQDDVISLEERISALESTKIALEDEVKRMKKQVGESIPKRNYKRIISEKDRLAASNAALLRNKSRLEKKLANTKTASSDVVAIRSLAKDSLARLLVRFLIKYEQHKKHWFTASGIQSFGGGQEEFDLFKYHSWSTIDAKLREMERVGLVRGRDNVTGTGRLFTIRHGASLVEFQSTASD